MKRGNEGGVMRRLADAGRGVVGAAALSALELTGSQALAEKGVRAGQSSPAESVIHKEAMRKIAVRKLEKQIDELQQREVEMQDQVGMLEAEVYLHETPGPGPELTFATNYFRQKLKEAKAKLKRIRKKRQDKQAELTKLTKPTGR